MRFGPPEKISREILKSKKADPNKYISHDSYDAGNKLLKILENSGKNVLGSGAECVVVNEGKDKVLAIKHSGILKPIDAKKEFYVHKILSTLYPYNFPKIYASFGKGEDNLSFVSGTIRQKIYNGEEENQKGALKKAYKMLGLLYLKISNPSLHKEDQEKSKQDDDKKIQKQIEFQKHRASVFEDIKADLVKAGLQINFDESSFNFMSDTTGNAYYVDMVSSYFLDKSKKEDLISFMRSKGLSETDVKIVNSSFDRIIALESEKMGMEVSFAAQGIKS